jgi:ankyrin repeat protein
MRRPLIAIGVFLLLGLLTSVGVAWALVLLDGERIVDISDPEYHDAWAFNIDRRFGQTRIFAACQKREMLARLDDEHRLRPASAPLPHWTAMSDRGYDPGARLREAAAGWPLRCVRYQRYAPTPGLIEAWDYANRGALAGRAPWKPASSDPADAIHLPLIPIPLGLVVNTVVFAGLWTLPFAPFVLLSRMETSDRRKRGECIRCGYKLSGSESARCPECGTSRSTRLPLISARHLVAASVIVIILLGSLTGFAVAFANAVPYPPLPFAAYRDDAGTVRRLLDSGADPETTVTYTVYPNPDFADPMKSSITPLKLAARNGSLDVVRALLDAGADVDGSGQSGLTALVDACAAGHLPVIDELIARGADVNAGRGPLVAAAVGGHVDVLERLIAAGVDVDRNPYILYIACSHDHRPFVEAMINHGCAVTAEALSAAVRRNRVEQLDWLLERGGNLLDRTETGQTLLFDLHADTDALPLWERLIDAGIDIDARDQNGMTALMAAEGAEVVRFLLKHGADPTITDNAGNTALDFALPGEMSELIENAMREWEARHGAATEKDQKASDG